MPLAWLLPCSSYMPRLRAPRPRARSTTAPGTLPTPQPRAWLLARPWTAQASSSICSMLCRLCRITTTRPDHLPHVCCFTNRSQHGCPAPHIYMQRIPTTPRHPFYLPVAIRVVGSPLSLRVGPTPHLTPLPLQRLRYAPCPPPFLPTLRCYRDLLRKLRNDACDGDIWFYASAHATMPVCGRQGRRCCALVWTRLLLCRGRACNALLPRNNAHAPPLRRHRAASCAAIHISPRAISRMRACLRAPLPRWAAAFTLHTATLTTGQARVGRARAASLPEWPRREREGMYIMYSYMPWCLYTNIAGYSMLMCILAYTPTWQHSWHHVSCLHRMEGE